LPTSRWKTPAARTRTRLLGTSVRILFLAAAPASLVGCGQQRGDGRPGTLHWRRDDQRCGFEHVREPGIHIHSKSRWRPDFDTAQGTTRGQTLQKQTGRTKYQGRVLNKRDKPRPNLGGKGASLPHILYGSVSVCSRGDKHYKCKPDERSLQVVSLMRQTSSKSWREGSVAPAHILLRQPPPTTGNARNLCNTRFCVRTAAAYCRSINLWNCGRYRVIADPWCV
jgi:hypothetical protein